MKLPSLITQMFRASASPLPRGHHMTWASRSVSQSINRTRDFLRKHLWVWPLVAVALLSIIGFAVRGAIESTTKNNLEAQLETLLNVETAMVRQWLEGQKSQAVSMAQSRHIREILDSLLVPPHPEETAPPDLDKLRRQLDVALQPFLQAHGFAGYVVFDKSRKIVASTHANLIGTEIRNELREYVDSNLRGEVTATPPFAAQIPLLDSDGVERTGVPTMFVAAPIQDADFQVVGALGLQMRPEETFTRILQLGRIGESGETYAFNKEGVMVSNSRFDDELILLGLIPDSPDSHSILNLLLRDPGGDMTQGFRPKIRRSELPFSPMLESAIAGKSGVNVDGMRDYRGVPIVNSWTWLPEYNFGVTTKLNLSEAYRPLSILKWALWTLYALLAIASLAIFIFTLIVARARRHAQHAELQAQRLGQYTLEQRLGSGGMGVVYKGRHTMLRRPTAIKMLEPEKLNEAAIARFENEVQITSQLNNPNTVAIYDFGRTPEGLFYYAMEYLDGIDLQALIDNYGPQPPARVIHILSQICGSLYEAHGLGLVHRDIKPANIMLNRRGGEPDVVKVLDFGLVKALDDPTAQQGMTGTPLYMSPEAIQMPNSVDARSDIYAVGAVGYFLLTGEPVFRADSVLELCQMHIDAAPKPLSQRTGQAFSPELEHAILACLEKSRARRPQTARDLAEKLHRCSEATQWSVDEADAWWSRHDRRKSGGPEPITVASSSKYAATIDQK